LQPSSTQLAFIAVENPQSVGMLAVQNVTNTRSITSRPVALDNVTGVMGGTIATNMDLSVNQYQNTSSIITTSKLILL
jgi:hypothetical protein